ncbi:MAG: hypothetical protein C0392_14450 [Syntrophus sp. (in: bacteria)]|nr:hypothetical protein [Syntrophus sp. (in: bacteria)]
MKKCPFCAEEIQEDAIKCKHCGEWCSPENIKEPAAPMDSIRRPLSDCPTNDSPYIMGKISVYQNHFVFEGKNYPFRGIAHIKSSHSRQTWGPMYTSAISGENIGIILTLVSGETISTKAGSVKFLSQFSSNKIYAFQKGLDYIAKSTFVQRFNAYVAYIERYGFLRYDNMQFYPDGRIISRKGTVIHLHEYAMEQGGPSIYFTKKDKSKLSQTIGTIVNRHPNTNFWRAAIHGDFTIDTSVDRDVFLSLLSAMYGPKK